MAQELGDPYTNEALVNKMLRTLPDRYNARVYALEETTELSQIALDELVSKLKTFDLNEANKKRGKSLALKSAVKSDEANQHVADFQKDMIEVMSKSCGTEDVALLTSKFTNTVNSLTRINSIPGPSSSIKPRKLFPNENSGSASKSQFSPSPQPAKSMTTPFVKINKTLKCRACTGYGHIASECANTWKRRGCAFNCIVYDDELEESNSEVRILMIVKLQHCLLSS